MWKQQFVSTPSRECFCNPKTIHPLAGFKSLIPQNELPQTHVLDRAAIVTNVTEDNRISFNK
jgi:hypothetical protein